MSAQIRESAYALRKIPLYDVLIALGLLSSVILAIRGITSRDSLAIGYACVLAISIALVLVAWTLRRQSGTIPDRMMLLIVAAVIGWFVVMIVIVAAVFTYQRPERINCLSLAYVTREIGAELRRVPDEECAFTLASKMTIPVRLACPQQMLCSLSTVETQDVLVLGKGQTFTTWSGTWRYPAGYPDGDSIRNRCAFWRTEKQAHPDLNEIDLECN